VHWFATRIALAGLAITTAIATRPASAAVTLKAAKMIIEFNASAEDIGVQFFLDSDGWKSIEIFDPRGREIFSSEAEGSLMQQGGGTELFLESVEPSLDELPLEDFFSRFPEGNYKFKGLTAGGVRITGSARFTHDVPAGPELVSPVPGPSEECATSVSIPAVIEWDPVTMSISDKPIDIVAYEVIVENGDLDFDVIFPARAGTMVTVPAEVLEPGTDYLFEVLAIANGGNQTITEGCFRTAP
jgi:hypothetical protein